jgi:hypothetical protein
MLFDLRGRGRCRTVQIIYLSLAILMGGGLVLFGIGGGTNGGLFDAIGGSSGGGTSADAVFKERLNTYEKRLQANPRDQASLVGMTKLYFGNASTGENYNQAQQAYTAKGQQQLRLASASWQRYLALKPEKPDPTAANVMTQAYGPAGLKQYDKAVSSLEVVIATRKETANLYAQLAILAAGAKQDRKSTLAENKALDLTPKAQRKELKSAIDLQKSQLNVEQPTQPQSG